MTEREISVYAIVRCGGRQEKASVDDVLTVDKLAGEPGSTLTLPAVLVVDDGKVISDPAALGGYQVTAEILGPVSQKPPPITSILRNLEPWPTTERHVGCTISLTG